MLPRYQPTYGYSDIWHSLARCNRIDYDLALRTRIADLYKVKHVFLFNSARAALFVILKAYNRPGGVLIPAYNCIVVPEAVCYAGYKPTFTDINLNCLNMNIDNIEAFVSSDISVILLTHLFGVPIDIDPILNYLKPRKILVVEDAAAAFGAKYREKLVGCFGDASIISFHYTKVISSESGGALLTNNDQLADKIVKNIKKTVVCNKRQLLFVKALCRKILLSEWVYPMSFRAYRLLHSEEMYQTIRYKAKIPKNYLLRCSDFASALIEMQMDRFKYNLVRRQEICKIYKDRLAGNAKLLIPEISQECSPSWIQFPIMVDEKKVFYEYMLKNKIDISLTYRYSCAESFNLNGYPNAEKAAKTVIGLPTYPSLTNDQVQYICDVANKFVT